MIKTTIFLKIKVCGKQTVAGPNIINTFQFSVVVGITSEHNHDSFSVVVGITSEHNHDPIYVLLL